MKNLLNIVILSLSSLFTSTDFSNSMDLIYFRPYEETIGVRLEADFYVVWPSIGLNIEFWISVITSDDVFIVKTVKDPIKRVGDYVYSTDPKLIPYSILDDNTKFVIHCFDALENRSMEVSLPYKSKRNAKNRITISENDNGKEISPGYLITNYEHRSYEIYKESFVFSDLEDVYIKEYNDGFSFKNLNFKFYKSPTKEFNGKFYFDFYDPYSLFEDFPYLDGTMYRRLEVGSVYTGNENHSLQLNKFIYYNPKTLKSSPKFKEGYVSTYKFYFPREEFNLVNNMKCRYVFEIDNGYEYEIFFPFTIICLNNVISDEDTSKYYNKIDVVNSFIDKDSMMDVYL